ncbi:FAD-dependent oxidoreductase [Aestuariimicrobium sp. Y1814]|uniref:glycerol-3-phosphate dehydrogenase/oxidase n=1 Tax=Aestuariimicrobium sp. Y1814 TaxID=3418742 RepID=UPI003DA725C4
MSRMQSRIVARQTAPVSLDRNEAEQQLAGQRFDVLVVGGGITGVSVALDAVTRGLSVALVERHDYASGTSSASSKMIHGGLRYVEQKEFRLVYHSLLERQRMFERAPHLVSRLPFLFPIYREHGVFGPRMARAMQGALWVYDLLGGWRIGQRHRRISAAETLTHCPTLEPQGLLGGLLYYDCRTDDARLTLAVGRTAALFGAVLINHAELVGVHDDGGHYTSTVRLSDPEGTRREVEVVSSVVVNAAGVWSDKVAALDEPNHPSRIRPAKGVHIVVPWNKVRSQSTLTFPMIGGARGKGGKGFVLRWGDDCYIGTTDSPYAEDLDSPRCTRQEAQVLIDSLNAALTTTLTLEDISGTWAALRPLIDTGGADTAELSREHEVTVHGRMVTVAGGKLTVGRVMAEIAVDRVCELLKVRRRTRTKDLPLVGGAGFDAQAVEATGGRFAHLGGRYGAEARFVDDLVVADPRLGERVVEELPYLWAEVVHAIRHEGATTVEDVLVRRLPIRYFQAEAAARVAPRVAEVIAQELGVPASVLDQQVADLVADVRAECAELMT